MPVGHINEPLLPEHVWHFFISPWNTPCDDHNMVLYISFRFNDTRYQMPISTLYQVSACDIQH